MGGLVMGWTSYYADVKYRNGRPYIDRKAECDKLFNWDAKNESGEITGNVRVLKSRMVGSTYYAAVKTTDIADESISSYNAAIEAQKAARGALKYIVVCPNCGKLRTFERRSKIVTSIQKNENRYRCVHCQSKDLKIEIEPF
jgi:hypothetical protein